MEGLVLTMHRSLILNQEAIELFLKSHDAIFHYTKKEIFLEKIAANFQLKANKFLNTNDPYEYKNREFLALENISWSDEQKKNAQKIHDEFDKMKKETRVLCFCENRDIENNRYGFIKPRMWAQYAENHTGVCLVLSRGNLLSNISSQINTIYSEIRHPIRYKNIVGNNDYPIIDSEKIFTQDRDTYIQDIINKSWEELFFTKDLDFQQEDEFRIMFYNKEMQSDKDYFINIERSLKAIVLGENFPDIYIPLVKSLLSVDGKNIGITKLQWNNGIPIMFTI